MKTIQPVTIWANGETKEATILNAYAVSVVLDSNATFYYSLLSDAQETLAQGNLTMDGVAYENWEQDETAWEWIADSLNLTITGDYVKTEE
jgi:hypothetical protein